jgi:hypothetical protein
MDVSGCCSHGISGSVFQTLAVCLQCHQNAFVVGTRRGKMPIAAPATTPPKIIPAMTPVLEWCEDAGNEMLGETLIECAWSFLPEGTQKYSKSIARGRGIRSNIHNQLESSRRRLYPINGWKSSRAVRRNMPFNGLRRTSLPDDALKRASEETSTSRVKQKQPKGAYNGILRNEIGCDLVLPMIMSKLLLLFFFR